jgi:hypothetical protein
MHIGSLRQSSSQSLVHWSPGVRYELSSLAQTLGSWVRISFLRHGCLCMRLFRVCVVLCVSSGLPRRPGFKPGSVHLEFCDGQKWRWGRFSPRTSGFHLRQSTFYLLLHNHLHYHPRPGVAAVPIVSQTRIKKKKSAFLWVNHSSKYSYRLCKK